MERSSEYRLTRFWSSATLASCLFVAVGCNGPVAGPAYVDDYGSSDEYASKKTPSAATTAVPGVNGGDSPPVGTAGSGSGAKGDSPGLGGSPASCFTVDLGLTSDDPAKAKAEGTKICEAKSTDLTKLSRSSADKAATWLATCCAHPPVEICSWSAIGDGSTCISSADLALKADALCKERKAAPSNLYPTNDCPGGATIAKLECCAPAPDSTVPPEK